MLFLEIDNNHYCFICVASFIRVYIPYAQSYWNNNEAVDYQFFNVFQLLGG